MFFYLFGKIYMGYVRNYFIGDVVVRFKKMEGYNVFYLMGWDFFGLLVENVVIKYGIYLYKWIMENIEEMKE